MTITLNGQSTPCADGSSILSLLTEHGLAPETVVVELNRTIIPGENYASTTLADGDHVEVLRFVGGG